MEHFALQQPIPMIAAPPGTRVILVQTLEREGTLVTSYDVLHVVGFQGMRVYHYAAERVLPVHPTRVLMHRQGWKYKHMEMRYAPIFIDREGSLSMVEPDDPRWALVDSEMPAERVEALGEALRAKEIRRQDIERQIENETDEQGREVEED